MDVNFWGTLAMVRAFAPVLAANGGGKVVNIASALSWFSAPGAGAYAVSKAALESASRYLARYLGERGIRSNIISAGPLDTIAKKAIPGAQTFNDIWGGRAPLGWDESDATPTAKGVVALLSDWFCSTTGEMIHVDGGLHSTGA